MGSLKEEYEKRKAETNKKPEATKLSWRDWVTLTLSILAFILSLGTAYFNLLRQDDDLSLTVKSVPFMNRPSSEVLTAKIDRPIELIFINSGNRPAVVSEISVGLNQLVDGKTRCPAPQQSDQAGTAWFATNFESFVIKEKEVATKKVVINRRFFGPPIKSDDTAVTLPIVDSLKPKNVIPVEVCLTLQVATPSLSSRNILVVAASYELGTNTMVLKVGNPDDGLKPYQLIRVRSTILSSWF